MMRTSWYVLVLVIGAALAACGGSGLPDPQPVSVGRVSCTFCRARITEPQYAAEAVYPDGTIWYYDDIGCMARDIGRLKAGAHLYVQLAGGRGWARAEDVTYASPASVHTPQAYDLVPYPEDETRAADRNGRARSWEEVVREAPHMERVAPQEQVAGS